MLVMQRYIFSLVLVAVVVVVVVVELAEHSFVILQMLSPVMVTTPIHIIYIHF